MAGEVHSWHISLHKSHDMKLPSDERRAWQWVCLLLSMECFFNQALVSLGMPVIYKGEEKYAHG